MKLLLVVLVLLASGCAALADAPPTPTPEAPKLQLRAVTDRVQETRFLVDGRVVNVSANSYRQLRAALVLFDEQDRPEIAYSAAIDKDVLLSGQEASFHFVVQYNPMLTRYRVDFVDLEGRWIFAGDADP